MATRIVAPSGQTPVTASVEGVTKAALALVGEAVGPFSPIRGPESIQMGGGIVALERAYHVDIRSVGREEGITYEAVDRDGHTWFVRRLGGWMVTAFREPTVQELDEQKDRADAMYRTDLPSSSLRACQKIANELWILADDLRPDVCAPRRQRRAFKRRMERLVRLQCELLYRCGIRLSELGPRLAELGIELPACKR